MTDITSARNIMQVEETRFRAPVGENLLTRMGAVTNFISKEQMTAYQFEYAGVFRPLFGGEGGILTIVNNQEIAGISGRIRNKGTSGSTTIDLHTETSGSDDGTVWSSQKLVIASGSGVGWFWFNTITPTSAADSDVTLPTFDSLNLTQGQAIRMDVDSNALGAQDLIINLWVRPRA